MPLTSSEPDHFQRFQRSLNRPDLIEFLRDGLIGEGAEIPGLNGPNPLIYADYVASGRALRSHLRLGHQPSTRRATAAKSSSVHRAHLGFIEWIPKLFGFVEVRFEHQPARSEPSGPADLALIFDHLGNWSPLN